MADLTGYFFDTSVLVAGIIEIAGPKHPAQRLMARVAEGRFVRPATAWHCCLEFYSVATRLPQEHFIQLLRHGVRVLTAEEAVVAL